MRVALRLTDDDERSFLSCPASHANEKKHSGTRCSYLKIELRGTTRMPPQRMERSLAPMESISSSAVHQTERGQCRDFSKGDW